jgi:hypothetical protein
VGQGCTGKTPQCVFLCMVGECSGRAEFELSCHQAPYDVYCIAARAIHVCRLVLRAQATTCTTEQGTGRIGHWWDDAHVFQAMPQQGMGAALFVGRSGCIAFSCGYVAFSCCL